MPKSQAESQLFVLLIAIDNYHPASGVSNLAGCVNDLKAVQKFIRKQYRDLNPKIRTLKNEKATRTQIIKTFRRHLTKNAEAGDAILFYYSGHGSHTKTAPIFEEFDGKKQDETFVCYDSRLPNKHDLTDKEMAVLLSEINEGVHTVVIADSCHSASMTRTNPPIDMTATFNLGAKRYTLSNQTNRNITSYLLSEGNYYSKLGEHIHIPRSKHILLSACSRDQEAWETKERRGLFTSMLLKVLEQNPYLSYSEMFARVRTLVNGKAKNQVPTIFPQEGFNPNITFLRSNVHPNPKRHQIKYDNNKWVLEYGAIDGLPFEKEDIEKLVIGVYANNKEETTQLTHFTVENVLLKTATLSEARDLDTKETYFGEIQSFPNALVVNLEGEEMHKNTIRALYEKLDKTSAFVQIVEGIASTKYVLKVTADALCIHLRSSGVLLHGVKGQDNNALVYIIKKLASIENWERLLDLQNKFTKFKEEDVAFQFIDETNLDQPIEYNSSSITLDYNEKIANNPGAIFYKIRARNNTNQDLHIALIQMSDNYGIANHFPCAVIPPSQDWVTLDDQHGIAITKPAINETTDVFKLIISTEAFDDFKLKQEGFDVGEIVTFSPKKSIIKRPTRNGIPDWFIKTIRVNTIRQQQKIGTNALKIDGLSIEAHPNFKATLSFAAGKGLTRSSRLGKDLTNMFEGEGFEMIDFSKKNTRSLQDQSIIELSNIEEGASLEKQPLVLYVDADLGKGGQILPVTMQGGFVVPLGETITEANGQTKIQINKIPKNIDYPPGEVGTRSLGRALWFSLIKFIGFEKEAFSLQKVNYRKGVGKRIRIRQKDIDKANKILIVTHGIIGDTKTMIEHFEFLKKEKHYDLILTFDYENLNTPIEKIAKQLNEQLESFNLGANDDKIIHILAHSMGGLVSRYMIEHIRKGDMMIDRLMMFGTPNGGSVLGKLPAFRDRLVPLLTLALNFGKGWAAWVNLTLGVVNKILIGSKKLTNTLAQMHPDSEFLKTLAETKDIQTEYIIIAGDITNYESVKEKWSARLMELLLLKFGNFINSKEANDIAVKVEDIKAIPELTAAIKYVIVCHHLNYFESEGGLLKLKELVSGNILS